MSYKLLLVDDERFMLSYLQSCIQWNKIDVEVVACAVNGEDAIEKTRLYKPDIIITDIVMPTMHGLEFIKNIYAQFKSTKIIILSGHQNFEFAKEALLYGVVDYVVKPSRTDDIYAAVTKAIKALELERAESRNYQKAMRDLVLSMPEIKRSVFSLLAHDNPRELCYEQLAEKCEVLGFEIESKKFICFKIFHLSKKLSHTPEFSCTELSQLEQIFSDVPHVLQILLSQLETNAYYGLISVSAPCADLLSVAMQKIESMLTDTENYCAAISQICESVRDIPIAFQMLGFVLDNRICSKFNLVIMCDSLVKENQAPMRGYSNASIIVAIQQLNEENSINEINKMFEFCILQSETIDFLRANIRLILREYDNVLVHHKSSLFEQLSQINISEIMLVKEESIYIMQEILCNITKRVIEFLQNLDEIKYPAAVNITAEYIKEHYAEGLTVQQLAQQLYISPNYLSSQFKKHTGVSISEYITICRIKKAKELMAENGDMKTYEVADMVGYNDYEYFRKVFKKYVGINPAKYKSFPI